MAGSEFKNVLGEKKLLIAVAAPAEWREILSALGHSAHEAFAPPWRAHSLAPGVDGVLTGVGKANAAAGVARAFDARAHSAVISLGVSGMLPTSGLALGQVVLGERSVYADEGGITPEGFVDIAQMGFPPDLLTGVDTSVGVPSSAELVRAFDGLADRKGDIATVSICSGTDAWAWDIMERTGAIAEAMEGAAVGFTCAQLGSLLPPPSGEGWGGGAGIASDAPAHEPPVVSDAGSLPPRGKGGEVVLVQPHFAEIRVISNTTGNRDTQKWLLKESLEKVGDVARQIAGMAGEGKLG